MITNYFIPKVDDLMSEEDEDKPDIFQQVISIHDSSFNHETWLAVLADCRSITDLHLDFNHSYSCKFITNFSF